MKNILIAILLLLFVGQVVAETEYKQITLKNRTAESVKTMLSPVLPKQCALSGEAYTLIVKCDVNEMPALMKLVKQLDVPEKTLIVQFKRLHNADYNLKQAHGKVQTYSTQPDSNQTQVRKISVQDGNEAYIGTGESFPYRDFYATLIGAGSVTQYKDLLSGFTIKPQLHGNQVKLTINWQYDALNRKGTDWERSHSTISSEQSSSVINLPLGKWINMSQFGTSSFTAENVRVYDTRLISDPKTNLLIRVDLAPQAGKYRATFPQGHY